MNDALRANERATDMIVRRRVYWCRAKVLHALAGAEEQGVLAEVLKELLPDGAKIACLIAKSLRGTGWIES